MSEISLNNSPLIVTVKEISTLGRHLSITIPSDRIDTAVEKKLRDLTKTIKLPGFSQGRNSPKLLEQKFKIVKQKQRKDSVIFLFHSFYCD